MRKWKVIGLSWIIMVIAAFMFALATGPLSGCRKKPIEGSAEYHLRRYEEIKASVYPGRPINIFSGKRARPPIVPNRNELKEEMERHLRTLIDLGYLAELSVAVSNRPASEALFYAQCKRPEAVPYREICIFGAPASNRIVIITIPEDIPKWTAIIRKVDVVEP